MQMINGSFAFDSVDPGETKSGNPGFSRPSTGPGEYWYWKNRRTGKWLFRYDTEFSKTDASVVKKEEVFSAIVYGGIVACRIV